MLSYALVAAALAQAPPPLAQAAPTDDYDLVVSLGVWFGSDWVHICTGTFVTPRVIVSAAHCADDYGMETVVAFGKGVMAPDATAVDNDDPAVISLSDGEMHPDYSGYTTFSTATADIAVLVAADPVEVEPARFLSVAFSDDQLGTELTAVGYGLTDADDQYSSGVRHAGPVSVDDYDSKFLLSDGAAGQALYCSGDSGGPIFHVRDDGRLETWGVIAYGAYGCDPPMGATRVDTFAEWILDHVEDVHGTRDICEVNGWYGDDQCDDDCLDVDPDCVDAIEPQAEAAAGCGCASTGAGTMAVWPAVLWLWGRRRRGAVASRGMPDAAG